MSARARRRRAWFGLQTVLGVKTRGFFLPYRYAETLPGPGQRPSYAPVEALFAGARDRFAARLRELDAFAEAFAAIGKDPAPAPRWDQDWFPRLDAAIAYAAVRRLAPRRIVEVGSGHSTRYLARAVADGALATQITAIDPAPRAALAGLAVTWIEASLPAAGRAPFGDLAAGDILMIDSSHLLMPGSDVDFLLGHLLPELPAGVVVQVHDIFLPDDYPAAWDWRGYNEQLGVLPLLFGGAWRVDFASHYAATRMAEEVAASAAGAIALADGAYESSLWLEKISR
ncbi:MAG: class I SAM-dependent methyltransferase [Pseudomonadota bacterium]